MIVHGIGITDNRSLITVPGFLATEITKNTKRGGPSTGSGRVVVVLTIVAGISWDLVQVYDVCDSEDY